MELEQVDVDSLMMYEANARTHSENQIAQIVKSIKKFGFCAPCLVDDDGVLIAGHGRLMAAKRLGMDKIPTVKISHLTPTQIKAYRIADNQLALNSGWDISLLGLELKDLQNEKFDLTLLGFDADLSGLPFSPSLDPKMTFHEIDEGEFADAAAQRDQQFEGIRSDKASGGIEVICPHCTETFHVVGN